MSETEAVDFDPRRIRRLRRYTWWSIVPTLPCYAVFPAMNLFLGATRGFYNAVEVVVLSVIGVVIAVEGTRLCASLMKGLGRGEHRPVVAGVVFALSLGAMAYALPRDQSGMAWAMLLSGLAGAHISAAPHRLRWPMTIGVLVLTGVTVTIVVSPDNPQQGVAAGFFIMMIVAALISLIVGVAWFWDIVLELDRARAVAAELGIAKERLRFAADLHDIQGHHLQVIALKAELAERLVGTDDDAARGHAAEVAELARTALKDTREVVHGYRRSNLTTELDNAREILEAAGIQTTVDGDATRVPPPLQPLFGALVREGTTNILRHSRAQRCELSISIDGSRTHVVLRNDRANPPNGAAGSGIDGLRQRFGTLGGRVDTCRAEDRFELHGSAAEPGRAS
ncbi:sensor histidine kinase [Saccharopolyspora sp. 5N708]|uniref:sensor histidine kinase n=1 Tax=Saccharopolyspora sp. 5N708 TaxID=3457424 RepID=UPI003FD68A43